MNKNKREENTEIEKTATLCISAVSLLSNLQKQFVITFCVFKNMLFAKFIELLD